MGRNIYSPLSYLGVEAKNPPNLWKINRAPTSSDYKKFDVGDLLLQIGTSNLWMLTDVSAGVATWTEITVSGNVTFSSVTIDPGDLVITTLNAGLLRSSSIGLISSVTDGDDLHVYMGVTGSDAEWGEFRSTGGTVVITKTPWGMNFESAGGTSANTFTTDDAVSVAPDGAGELVVSGGLGIRSTGDAVGHSISLAIDNISINDQAGITYTLVLTDSLKELRFTSVADVTVTVPDFATVAFEIGSQLLITQYGAGTITLAGAGGVTINSASGFLSTYERYSGAVLINQDNDEWLLMGDLK